LEVELMTFNSIQDQLNHGLLRIGVYGKDFQFYPRSTGMTLS